MSEEVSAARHDLDYWRRRCEQAEAALAALAAELAALRQLHAAIEALPDSPYEPGCGCDYCAAIDACRLQLRQ